MYVLPAGTRFRGAESAGRLRRRAHPGRALGRRDWEGKWRGNLRGEMDKTKGRRAEEE